MNDHVLTPVAPSEFTEGNHNLRGARAFGSLLAIARRIAAVLGVMAPWTASADPVGVTPWSGPDPEVPPIVQRVVYRDAAGRVLSPAELQEYAGYVDFELVDAVGVPEQAQAAFRAGREAGEKWKLRVATGLFWKAHRLAPGWPYPAYEAAWCFLLEGNTTKAEELYARVDRMAPRGFYTSKTALDCLRRERTGELPRGSYRAYLLLEGEELSKRVTKLRQMVARSARFAAAWKDLAFLESNPQAAMAALENGLAADPDAETRSYLLLKRAEFLANAGRFAGGESLLVRVVSDPTTTVRAEAAARTALASLRSRHP